MPSYLNTASGIIYCSHTRKSLGMKPTKSRKAELRERELEPWSIICGLPILWTLHGTQWIIVISLFLAMDFSHVFQPKYYWFGVISQDRSVWQKRKPGDCCTFSSFSQEKDEWVRGKPGLWPLAPESLRDQNRPQPGHVPVPHMRSRLGGLSSWHRKNDSSPGAFLQNTELRPGIWSSYSDAVLAFVKLIVWFPFGPFCLVPNRLRDRNH